ncbi:CRTAC1 family protein [Runella salmonicolor]|uniref:CRTAC1 family protein n=1 Tax=Runella salmonicolor TaxID=2950278 RepID=A0ABT1FXN3_9BACT|nr:CRTAC1 family protein [Runella salmonicolor]MCP1386536.1 CRTAC1 family protein [Runella salmonicolor]
MMFINNSMKVDKEKMTNINQLVIKTIGVLLVSLSSLWGQLRFLNATAQLPNANYAGYWSKAVVDLDGNGLDDIISTQVGNKSMYVFYQTQPGTFRAELIKKFTTLWPLSTTVGDLNNDKRNDIITGSNRDGLTIQYNQGSGVFREDTVMNPRILMQAASMVDINNDGWLDYSACNDNGLNQLWKNDKTGKLIPVFDWIDFKTVPTSDNSGNYGLVWSDIDNDGDLDLYIAKCSIYAMNAPTDPRRINQLFINNTYSSLNGEIIKNPQDFSINPTGWFTEAALAYNVKISGQSWSADFADIDNDGDQDLLVTNHESPTMLLENDGTGHFTDITTTSQLAGLGHPLQGIMRDFDNDGYVDILIAGNTEGQLWRNNHNKTFTKQANAFGSAITNSFAVGDLNHDGFYDVYTSYNPSLNKPDSLWLNPTNTNHFLAVTLQGRQSNTNGVGAKITAYLSDQTIQVREVRAGESYGITNTYTQIIGLGQQAMVTKVVLQWPSGQVDTYLNPNIDQYLYLTEGGCIDTLPNQPCQTSCKCGVVEVRRI